MKKTNLDSDRKLDRAIGIFWVLIVFYLMFSVAITKYLIGAQYVSSGVRIFLFLGLLFFVLLRFISPRCPNCGLGIYSIFEIKKFPILIKQWSGKNCEGCGVALRK